LAALRLAMELSRLDFFHQSVTTATYQFVTKARICDLAKKILRQASTAAVSPKRAHVPAK
jgi:hypothetical protein